MKHVSAAHVLRSLTALVLALLLPFNAMAATLTLPAALTTVQEQAFMNNASVEEIIVPEGTLRIESQAFAGCTALTRAVIPASVEYIAQDAFDGLQDALVIEAPADSYAAAWAREHGFVTRHPNAVLTGEIDHYFPTLYLGGNLDSVDVASVQLDYALEEGEAIDWQMENLSGEGTVNLYIDEISEDGVGAYVFADSVQATGESVWRLTAAAPDGQSWSAELTMEVVPMPEDMPTEIIVPYPVTGTVGERFVFKPSERLDTNGVIPDNGNLWFYGIATYRELWEQETFELIDDGMNGAFAFTPDQNGRYGITISLYLGNHRIHNENIIVIGSGASADGFLSVLESDPVYVSGIRDFWAGNVSLERFPLLPGETVEWSIELISSTNEQPAAILNIDETGTDPMFRDLFISEMSGVPGTDTYRITARVGDSVFTYDYVLDVQEMNDTLPTAITVPNDYFEVEIGDTLELYREDIRFVDGEVSEDVFVASHYWMLDQISHEQEVWDIDGGYAFRFVRNGRYTIEAALVLGGIEYTLPITIKVGTGVSDMAYLRTSQMVDTVYLESTEDNFIGNYEVGDYEPLENETFDWQIECLGDEENAPVRLYIDNKYDDGRGVNVHFEDVSGETGSVTYRITVRTSEGLERSAEITVSVKHLPGNLPTALVVPQTDYQLSVGESIYLAYADVRFADGEVPEDVAVTTEFWDAHLLPDVEMTEDGIRARFFGDGRYMIYAAKRIGSYTVVQPITITVGSGLAEDVHLAEDHIMLTHYVNMDDVNWAGDLYLENYQLFEGETLEWKAERIDENEGAPAELILDPTWDENRGAGLRLVNFSGETGSMTWRVTLESSFGFSWSKEYDIEVLPRPEDLPTGVTMPEEVVYLEVGETYYANYSDIQFVDGEVPEDAVVVRSLMTNELEDYPTLEWTEEGFEVTFHEDGRHIYTISGTINGVEMYKDIALIVGSGIPEDAWVEWWGTERTIYTHSDFYIWAFDAYVHNYNCIANEAFHWEIEQISEGEPVARVEQGGEEWPSVWYDFLPTGEETGTVVYRVTLTTDGGFQHSQEITVHVVDRPDDLPTDLIVPQTEYYLQPGETLTVRASDVDIADGVVPEDAWTAFTFGHMEALEELEDFRHLEEEEGFEVTFHEEGRYYFETHLWINNVLCVKEIYVQIGDGISDNARLDCDQLLHTAYTDADHDAYVGGFGLDGYRILPDDEYEWTLELISAPENNMPLQMVLADEFEDGNGINIHATGINDGTGSVTYRLHFTSGGLDLSTDITIDVVERPDNLPTALIVPETQYYLNPGDVLELYFDEIDFADGEVPEGADVVREFWECDWLPGFEWIEGGFRAQFDGEGHYMITAAGKVGNHTVTQPITIIVGDGIDDAVELTERDIHMTHFVNMDQVNWAGELHLDNYELAAGESLAWKAERIDENEGAPAELICDPTWDEERGTGLRLTNFSGETGSMTWRVTLESNFGFSWSREYDIEVLPRPENLPTGVTMPEEVVYLEVGETYYANYSDIQFVDGEVTEDMFVRKEFWLNSLEGYPTLEWTEEGFEVTFHEENRYVFNAVASVNGVDIVGEIALIVGGGISEHVSLEDHQQLHTAYINADHDAYVGGFTVEGYLLVPGEEYEWTLELISDPENAPVKLWFGDEIDGWRGMNIHAGEFTGETGSVTYRLRITTGGGLDLSTDITIDVVERPDNLPTALNVPETLYYFNPGDVLELYHDQIDFADGEVPEGADVIKEFWDWDGLPNFEWIEGGFRTQFDHDDRYQFTAAMKVGNHTVTQPITIIVGSGIPEGVWLNLQCEYDAHYINDQDHWLLDACLEDFLLLEGDHVEWTIECTDETDTPLADMYIQQVWEDGRRAAARISSFSGESGVMSGRLTATVNGEFSVSEDFQIEILPMPEGLPTEIAMPAEEIHLEIGEWFYARVEDIFFVDGFVPEDARVYTEFHTGDLGDNPDFRGVDGGFDVVFHEDGNHRFTAFAGVNGVEYRKDIVIYVGTGYSEDAYVDWAQEIETIYTDLPEVSTWIGWGVLENFAPFGEDSVQWRFDRIDEGEETPVELYMEVFDGVHADIRYTNVQGTGSVTYRLSVATSNGFEDSFDFTVNVEELPGDLPTDIDVGQTHFDLEVGGTYEFDGSQLRFVDGNVPQNASYRYHLRDLDPIANLPTFEWTENGFRVTFEENGRFAFGVGMQLGNYVLSKEITISVGSGIADDAHVEWYQELFTAYNGGEDAWIGHTSLHSYPRFGDEELTWTIERIDENENAPVELYIDNLWEDHTGANIHLRNLNGETGTVTYRVTVESSYGFTDSCEVTLDVVETPANLPTLLHVPAEEWRLEIGDELVLHDWDLTLSDDGEVPEGAYIGYEYWDPEGVFYNQEVRWNDEHGGFTVRFHDNGRYVMTVAVRINNYVLQREMRFTVGTGISEDTYLDLAHIIDPVYVDGGNAWIGNAYLHNYSLFEGESIEWTITRKDDGQEPVVDVVLDEEGYWDDTLGANYHVENVNATGETAYILQAKLPTGETFEQELVAHVQEMPEGLPTELITPWDSCLFTVGDTFTFMLSEIQFGEGYLPENAAYHMDIWPDGEIDQLPTYEWFHNEEGDEGVSVTFTEPGVYNICAAAWIGNYMLFKDIPITVTGGDDWKIAILTGTENQSEEEYTAARRALDTYGYGHVILDTYPDNFVAGIETTISRIEAFARDPEVKAIIVAQSVPGTLEGFNRVSETRDDVLLISGVPMEDIGAMHDTADIVMLSDEGRQAEPIMNKCEEWGVEVFVHYSFPRHLELSEVAERRNLLAGMAEELGIEFVEVEIPDPIAATGLEYSRSFVYGDVAAQMDRYLGRKVAFFCTNCGVQSTLQSAVLAHGNAYYPQPCCPSPYHGFGETLGLNLDMNDPKGALCEVANALNEHGAAGRFSTWAAPVNMGIVDIGVEYAVAYAGGALSPDNDKDFLRRLAQTKFRGAHVSNDEFENVYTILLSPVNFMDYVTMH